MQSDVNNPVGSSDDDRKRMRTITKLGGSPRPGALMLCGGVILGLGAALIKFYEMERTGILVASIGLLIVTAGLTIGSEFLVGKGHRSYSAFRILLRVFAGVFLVAAFWGGIHSVFTLYRCWQLLRREIYVNALDICLFAGVELIIAAGCAYISMRMLRYLREIEKARNARGRV